MQMKKTAAGSDSSLIRLIRSQTTYPRLSPDPSLEVPVTHLTVLITHWHLQVAGYLCEVGANKEAANQNGSTPLCVASCQGHLDVVRYLCKAGADNDWANNTGLSALGLAMERQHLDVARRLRQVFFS